jgi:putative transposase
MLDYKAAEAGVRLEKVDPRGTSQICFVCRREVPKVLSVRTHDCPHCGFVADRDNNAALNVLFLGLTQAGREPDRA